MSPINTTLLHHGLSSIRIALLILCRVSRKQNEFGNMSEILECSQNGARNTEMNEHRNNGISKPEINVHNRDATPTPDNEYYVTENSDVIEEKGKTQL